MTKFYQENVTHESHPELIAPPAPVNQEQLAKRVAEAEQNFDWEAAWTTVTEALDYAKQRVRTRESIVSELDMEIKTLNDSIKVCLGLVQTQEVESRIALAQSKLKTACETREDMIRAVGNMKKLEAKAQSAQDQFDMQALNRYRKTQAALTAINTKGKSGRQMSQDGQRLARAIQVLGQSQEKQDW